MLLGLLALLTLGGCTPCEESCRVQAANFEDCLGAWGLEWVDVGASGRVDYRRGCVADTDVWLDGLSPDERADENQQCAASNAAIREAVDCEAVRAALIEYGAL